MIWGYESDGISTDLLPPSETDDRRGRRRRTAVVGRPVPSPPLSRYLQIRSRTSLNLASAMSIVLHVVREVR